MDHTRHAPRRASEPRRPSAPAAWAQSRRGFIRLGAAGLLAGAAGATLPPRLGRAGGGGMPFAEPPVRASRNGVLDTTLTARLGPVRIGDRVATRWTATLSTP